ncbi:MAG: hypothetical protein IJ693_00080 [Bacteroidaceae bacterium]|nr:hypothetical protein [Bacteroidaceae bacterium]
MKKNIFALALGLVATVFVTSCKEEDGTNPGSDGRPAVTIYQYAPSSDYDADSDIALRFASNSATEAVYYLAEKTETYEENLNSMGEEGYKNHVVSDGTKVENLSGANDADLVLQGLKGAYTIAVVAVKGGTKTLSTTTFEGMDWQTKAVGTYQFGILAKLGMEDAEGIELQQLATSPNTWRFKNLYGKGQHLNITTLDLQGEDEDGVYTFLRVPQQGTGLTYGDYGEIFVRDVGYWQGDDAYVTDYGYEGGMYEDYSCFLIAQFFVSAGNLGYNAYDYFIPE